MKNLTTLVLAGSLIAPAVYAQTRPNSAAPTVTSTTPGAATPGTSATSPMTPGSNPSTGTAAGARSSTGTAPGAGVVDRNTGAAAASGDRNQAVTTTTANAPQPAKGANSFSTGEARRRIESHGFSKVTDLKKDRDGIWRGTATKDGATAQVWLDYKGNVGAQ